MAKHVIVTGGNSGIGKATALELAKRGMAITLACRNVESGSNAVRELISLTGNQSIRSMQCDLASFRSIRKFVDEYRRAGYPLHVLINNAGVMACPLDFTRDGFEMQFGTNHLGHFLLTILLMELLHSSATKLRKTSRVVVLASEAERIGQLDFEDLNFSNKRVYNPWLAYAQSKLANCLFSLELSRQCESLNLPITCNSIHPGIVDTKLIRHVFPGAMADTSEGKVRSILRKLIGLRSPLEGAQTAIHLATSDEVEFVTGQYFKNCCVAKPSSQAMDKTIARKLWQVCEELTGDKLNV
ncbi:retinol dehydrogenase 11 [Selaginella moellendorffii]|uniref:retinol dehydrogenase 11 n=1 Tax=Selaginella moellendorffii TaxID=88036 RepID=UPI000D1C8C9B|nr:retinol dehydrogenase 11 [Selaginella moellendorffii]|eukprot:XP_002977312.2 retinol dehydrogenase 11 [Selaginella moellendorffii]